MRSVTLIICAVAVALSGCGAKSIGIIGGADGPTKVVVSDDKGSTEYGRETVKMIRIDGALYYDTGKKSDVEGRCGTMDGAIKKGASENEIPQNDNESNFSGADGYQIGLKENTVETVLDGDWEIFAKIDTNADIFKYKYCCILNGRLPKAETDSRYLVLANNEDITFSDAGYQLFGSDMSKMKDIYVLPID